MRGSTWGLLEQQCAGTLECRQEWSEQRGSGRRRGHGEVNGWANHRLRSGFRCYFEMGSHWRILKRGTETGRPAKGHRLDVIWWFCFSYRLDVTPLLRRARQRKEYGRRTQSSVQDILSLKCLLDMQLEISSR